MSQAGTVNSSGGGGSGILEITPDVGGAVTPVAGNINLNGAPDVVTSKSGPGSILISVNGFVQNSQVQLTSSQVKNLSTVPIHVISAPGSGSIISVISSSFKLNYGGTSPFTNAGTGANISYFDGTSVFQIDPGTARDSTVTASTTTYQVGPIIDTGPFIAVPASIENLPVVIDKFGDVDYAGNAEDNNTLDVALQYVILTLS